MSAPLTLVRFIARTCSASPVSVTGSLSIVSARNPTVWVFAMLLAITRSRVIDAAMPESAV